MSERDFYLLVREYFNHFDLYMEKMDDSLVPKAIELRERIDKALSEFTKKDVNELPFK